MNSIQILPCLVNIRLKTANESADDTLCKRHILRWRMTLRVILVPRLNLPLNDNTGWRIKRSRGQCVTECGHTFLHFSEREDILESRIRTLKIRRTHLLEAVREIRVTEIRGIYSKEWIMSKLCIWRDVTFSKLPPWPMSEWRAGRSSETWSDKNTIHNSGYVGRVLSLKSIQTELNDGKRRTIWEWVRCSYNTLNHYFLEEAEWGVTDNDLLQQC